MKLKEFSYLLLLLVSFPVFGQLTISGQVTDVEGNPVPDAEMYIKELERLEITNNEGAFLIENLTAGTYTIVVFAYEFEIIEQDVTINGNTEFNPVMNPLKVQNLSEVVITQKRQEIFALKQLKKVDGTAIYAGKKNEVVLLDGITGNLAANNPRQIYSQVVGLNIYDNGDAGLQLNIGGRGLDPNRTANFNTRQNGYDISADVLGYPESYYTPPAEALEEIQVVRGAASLQYGTQFGGLVNFKFKQPNSSKKIEWTSRQTLGSYNLKTSFNSLSGTVGKFSYYTYFNYKEGNSFRPNSDYNSRNYFAHVGYQFTDKTKITVETTFLNYLAKQPGGLTDAQFIEDPTFSNRERNWFDVDWKLFSVRLDHKFSSKTDFSLNVFGLDASRSALGFRTNRVSQPDDPEEPRELLIDNFQNWGAEARLLTRYKLGDTESALLIGSKIYRTDNDQRQGPGTSAANADFNFAEDEFPNYERQSQFNFPNSNLAFFGENIFNISPKLTLTPGFRLEHIKTESIGSYKNIVLDLAGNPLLNEEVEDNREFDRTFLLLGLGATYKLNSSVEFYGNFSQNYRSVTFSDIRVVNPSFQVDENISDEDGFTADIGFRGRHKNVLSYDVSAFSLLYDNRLGEILKSETQTNALGEEVETGSIVRFRGNIGTAFMYGLESFANWSVKETFFSASDKLKLNYFMNLAMTNSEYLSSEETNVEGNKVEFIPDVNLKTGLNFGYGNILGSLQYTYLSSQFTDATNALQDVNDNQRGIEGEIPAYDILDFSLSYVYKNWKLETGINNVLDNSYFTRRATGYPGPGIIPSEPRTFYATLQFKL
ncbi:MAG TPA: TonB-dependent receptor [Maribacter sp.]|uniref:TonB-dependent receptor domain-containing protein n=1 Tax=unclassified Maribacter TaxID=2615042 RepID=UPI000EBB6420|nr:MULTISPECIES: TonB-dependent receptor [unclassified Maribacter]HAF76165.1 TonB-dependent receptor [Maribacter sp.]|tara:strand:- start:84392 stop:86863 length:2472 start_codon:yes stop_codon:yes gene_type:complete